MSKVIPSYVVILCNVCNFYFGKHGKSKFNCPRCGLFQKNPQIFSRVEDSNTLHSLVSELNIPEELRNDFKDLNEKSDQVNTVENLIDLMPVELRTARWLVREQDTYLNKAREEAYELLSIAKLESDRLIADSYVLQEAVIEANALIKKAEDEAQAYRAQIEDQIDVKLTEVLNKFEQINN